MKKTALLLAAALLSGGAGAQNVWRCGSTYTDSPCPGGRTVAVADQRNTEQATAAAEAAAREERLASKLAAERTQREQDARRNGGGLMAIGPFAKPETFRPKASKRVPAHRPKQHRLEAPDTFRAAGPSSPRTLD